MRMMNSSNSLCSQDAVLPLDAKPTHYNALMLLSVPTHRPWQMAPSRDDQQTPKATNALPVSAASALTGENQLKDSTTLAGYITAVTKLSRLFRERHGTARCARRIFQIPFAAGLAYCSSMPKPQTTTPC